MVFQILYSCHRTFTLRENFFFITIYKIINIPILHFVLKNNCYSIKLLKSFLFTKAVHQDEISVASVKVPISKESKKILSQISKCLSFTLSLSLSLSHPHTHSHTLTHTNCVIPLFFNFFLSLTITIQSFQLLQSKFWLSLHQSKVSPVRSSARKMRASQISPKTFFFFSPTNVQKAKDAHPLDFQSFQKGSF